MPKGSLHTTHRLERTGASTSLQVLVSQDWKNPDCAFKSSGSAIGTDTLNQLKGDMQTFNARERLLVAWGGFAKDALVEARQSLFSIRLWNQGDLLNEITKHYEEFDIELEAELPLKRIWALVDEGE